MSSFQMVQHGAGRAGGGLDDVVAGRAHCNRFILKNKFQKQLFDNKKNAFVFIINKICFKQKNYK
jgi:hypothetical protein